MKLADKVAVITGAGSGIGYEMATLFAREGARIMGADVDADGLASYGRRLWKQSADRCGRSWQT